ncbi:HD domain-containing protein [bacterium]|nr:HD domain-containing protein [bacterium]
MPILSSKKLLCSIIGTAPLIDKPISFKLNSFEQIKTLEDRFNLIFNYFDLSKEDFKIKIEEYSIGNKNKFLEGIFLLERENNLFIEKIISVPIYIEKTIKTELVHNNLYIKIPKNTNYDIKKVFEIFLDFLKEKDKKTYNHCIRVGELSLYLAKNYYESDFYKTNGDRFKIAYENKIFEYEDIFFGGILHDIGKIFIPNNILFKKNSLNENELNIMGKHMIYGRYLIENIPFIKENLYLIVNFHHEKWDGSGQYKMKGDDIPAYLKFVSFSDILDALNSERTYKNSYSYKKIFELLYTDIEENFKIYFEAYFLNYTKNNWDKIVDKHSKLK